MSEHADLQHRSDAEGPRPDDLNEHLVRPRREMRQAFIEGAEEDTQRRLGRGLTVEELERILWHYPGDLGERREQ